VIFAPTRNWDHSIGRPALPFHDTARSRNQAFLSQAEKSNGAICDQRGYHNDDPSRRSEFEGVGTTPMAMRQATIAQRHWREVIMGTPERD